MNVSQETGLEVSFDDSARARTSQFKLNLRGKAMRLSLFQLLFGFRVATDDVWSTSITLLN
jgi:hypothetical protein